MKWWTERLEPWLNQLGETWATRITDWLREKFNIPRRDDEE